MLRCTVAEINENRNWVDILSIDELAIKSSPNQTTAYSPFYLNYGYHPTVATDLMEGDELTRNEYVGEFCKRMTLVRNKAVKQMKNGSKIQEKHYNERHKFV